jgi:serine phosphatase RsbU (regulator of sigma subunit)/anti-sigma regulatory factor (Ser/Thr protein kinase)/PAS domain-containing protein
MPGGADAIGLPPQLALDTLAHAIEGTATGVWMWEVEADRIHWTPNLGPLHGLDRGEAPLSYAEWAEQVHPDDRERVEALIADGLRTGTGFEFEFRAGGVDPPRWLHARAQVQPGEAGRTVVVGVTLDVTARRRREAERERLHQRLRGLQKVTDVALAHLELDALLEELLARVSELLGADIAKVLLFDEQRTELRVRKAHGLPDDAVAELRVPAGGGVAGRIASGGRPMILSGASTQDAVLQHLRDPGRSTAGVPLHIDDAVLGVLLVSSRDRAYDAHDLVLLELVADRAARAIRQSELYEAARDAALSLQRSLLPAALPTVPGLEAAARYLPGQDGTEVGGDWYDLFTIDDGRVAMVVGDVVGRGLRAAARMGTVRTAVRAYALEAPGPADALERLDRFVAGEDPLEFTTLLVAFIDPASGRTTISSAGHLPPLIVTPDGARLLDAPADPPLGVADGPRREAELTLAPGEAIVAYTDGLVEDRATGIVAGLEALGLIAPGDESAEGLVDRILDALDGAAADDDVVVCAVRRIGDSVRRTYRAEPGAVASARHDVTAFAQAHGAPPALCGDVALAVSEACTNVVVHAYRHGSGEPGAMHVEVASEGHALRVTVEDEGCGVRPRGDSPGVGLGLQIIARTTSAFEVERSPSGGARLVLRFAGDLRLTA